MSTCRATPPSRRRGYIHGGGWVGGTKEAVVLHLIPDLKHGMAVVTVEYRLARESLAPAAVADCRCALRWVIEHAKQHGFDTSRIVVTGARRADTSR